MSFLHSLFDQSLLLHNERITHGVKCNWQCVSLFQREYMDGKQASSLVIWIRPESTLSRQGII